MPASVLRTPDERFADLADYPFQPRFLETAGLRLHYVDEGAGRPVVLFHGEPTWSYLYRKVIPPLVAAGYRAIAPDYAGFGKSDKPTNPGFYTYDAHVALMAAVLDRLDISGATAVVQDWGGPIGLRLTVEHPEWFDRLVVMNTGLFSGGRVGAGFMQWRQFVERTPDLPIRLIMGRSSATEWPEAALDGYDAPFPDKSYKVGAHRFPLIVPLSTEDEGAAEMADVKSQLAGWGHPSLVLFGTEDPIFPVRVGERWVERLSGAGPLELVEAAGHFLQEDQGETVAERIIAFLQRTD
jgi:haloalkane dehalogenase